jgi:hypothetical protein
MAKSQKLQKMRRQLNPNRLGVILRAAWLPGEQNAQAGTHQNGSDGDLYDGDGVLE